MHSLFYKSRQSLLNALRAQGKGEELKSRPSRRIKIMTRASEKSEDGSLNKKARHDIWALQRRKYVRERMRVVSPGAE
jgi:hypothetical protein